MKWKRWKPYILWVVLVEAVGTLSGLISRDGEKWFNENAAQPPLSPPAAVFPIVWGILYALMGISAARVWLKPDGQERRWGLNLFIGQLVLNFFWSLIFFNARAYGLASLWIVLLWIVVLLMLLRFRKVDPVAGWLQVPYLLWLSFAAYLAFRVWVLNR